MIPVWHEAFSSIFFCFCLCAEWQSRALWRESLKLRRRLTDASARKSPLCEQEAEWVGGTSRGRGGGSYGPRPPTTTSADGSLFKTLQVVAKLHAHCLAMQNIKKQQQKRWLTWRRLSIFFWGVLHPKPEELQEGFFSFWKGGKMEHSSKIIFSSSLFFSKACYYYYYYRQRLGCVYAGYVKTVLLHPAGRIFFFLLLLFFTVTWN